MRPLPESLEITCPMCGEDLVLVLRDEAAEPAMCQRCGYRLDTDPALREQGFIDLRPDPADVRGR